MPQHIAVYVCTILGSVRSMDCDYADGRDTEFTVGLCELGLV